jgi:hypothetical protein
MRRAPATILRYTEIMRTPLLLPFAAVVVDIASSCALLCADPAPREAPPCTPEAAGFRSADAVELARYEPPAECEVGDLASFVGAEIVDDETLRAQLACTDEGGNPAEPPADLGIDFAREKIFVVRVEAIGQPTGAEDIAWSVRDADGLHIGAIDGHGCSGAAPVDVAVPVRVLVDDDVTVSSCSAGSSCGGCGFSQPP